MSREDVLSGKALWSVEQADAVEFLRSLPPDSVDLCFFSPPYTGARLYLEGGKDLGIARDAEAWTAWMAEVFTACQRACKGLVACVCEGQTKNYRWDAAPALLMADLHRAGFLLRRPCIYHRVGIPGSGGPDWLRADTEYIICTARAGKLPWSDNTAMGHPPKWAPGGEMSHRLSDGTRRNEWGRNKTSTEARSKNGQRQEASSKKLPIKKIITRPRPGQHSQESTGYDPPAIANPGNLLKPTLTLAELISILSDYEQKTHSTADQVLRDLRQANSTGNLREWFYGVCLQIRAASLLQSSLCGAGDQEKTAAENVPPMWRDDDTDDPPKRGAGELDGVPREEVLQPQMPGEGGGKAGRTEARRLATPGEEDCQTDDAPDRLRKMRADEQAPRPSSGRGCNEQSPQQSSSLVSVVPPQRTQERILQSASVYGTVQGIGVLQQALPALQEVWQSVGEMLRPRPTSGSSNLIHCTVGGNQLGSPLAHSSEAPFPEYLAEFFVRSFCPSGGIVCDPFSGSGTTATVALRWKRRFLGCDLRQSQVDLTTKRVGNETPLSLLFDDALTPEEP